MGNTDATVPTCGEVAYSSEYWASRQRAQDKVWKGERENQIQQEMWRNQQVMDSILIEVFDRLVKLEQAQPKPINVTMETK